MSTDIAGKSVSYLNMEPVRILSDAPLSEKADFGFEAYVKTIAGLIANKNNHTPLVIGVYGKWGSGKTTLMENIQTELRRGAEAGGEDESPFRICKPVWFQAWKYKNEDEILAALIQEIFTAMEKDDFFTKCRGQIEKLVKSLNKTTLAAGLIKQMTLDQANDRCECKRFFSDIGTQGKAGFL